MLTVAHLTPAELISKYPVVAANFNWTARELGLFLKCKLLDGYYDRNRRTSLIKETSFIHLVGFVNEVIEKQKIRVDQPSN